MAVIHGQVFCVCIFFLVVLSSAFENILFTTDEEQPIILTPGEDLLLNCNTTELQGISVNWTKNGVSLDESKRISIFKENNTVLLKQTTVEDAAYYMCFATKDEKLINATIVVVYPAKIEPLPKSINLVQDDKLNLVCKAQGFPPVNIRWMKGKEPVNTTDPRIKFESEGNIENARLVVESVVDQDRGEYTCIASNAYSEANSTILVRVKDKYAALWPFLGICVEVAILCTIIFVYEKRRQKPDFDESDTDHNPDSKNAPDTDDKSQDVRQRK